MLEDLGIPVKDVPWNVWCPHSGKRLFAYKKQKLAHVLFHFCVASAGLFTTNTSWLKHLEHLAASWPVGVLGCSSCSEVFLKQYSITIRLTHVLSGTSFYVTNVYGPLTWEGKEEFCSELARLKDECKYCWVLCGDFNFTRNQSERRGKTWSVKASNMFNDLIRYLEMLDLPMKNQAFTWSNMQTRPTMAKLDRFLISTEWDQ